MRDICIIFKISWQILQIVQVICKICREISQILQNPIESHTQAMRGKSPATSEQSSKARQYKRVFAKMRLVDSVLQNVGDTIVIVNDGRESVSDNTGDKRDCMKHRRRNRPV